MNGNFKVGDVCIGQNCMRLPMYNGMECVVVKGLGYHRLRDFPHSEAYIKLCYIVKWADGWESGARPDQLRRKQPPSGELSILNMFVVAPPQRTKEIA